jgi:flagellar biosynthetic protein FliO
MNAATELIPSALTMIGALAAVLGGIFVVVYFARRFLQRQGPASRERLIRVLASHYIGVKKAVTLVEVPGAVLVLGVAGDRMQLLTRIDDPAILERIRSREPQVVPSFAEHLNRLTTRRKAADHDDD